MGKTKRNIIIIIIVALILGGLSLILYPFITNFIVLREQADTISEWEKSLSEGEAEESPEMEEKEIPEEEALVEEEEEVIAEDIEEKPVPEDYFPMKITIPSIELEWLVYEGTDTETLKKGPGHIPQTPLPGQNGRFTISGHRTTYGAPFNKVDELKDGDFIYLKALNGETFTYTVTGQIIVKPEDVHILNGTEKKELLLTACHPKYSAADRIIIIAELIEIFDIGYLLNE